MLAETDDNRTAALAELPLQRADFIDVFTAMAGLPVTIRLLDPPLHEFLPDLTELSVRVALAHERGEPEAKYLILLEAVRRLHEENSMSLTRACDGDLLPIKKHCVRPVFTSDLAPSAELHRELSREPADRQRELTDLKRRLVSWSCVGARSRRRLPRCGGPGRACAAAKRRSS